MNISTRRPFRAFAAIMLAGSALTLAACSSEEETADAGSDEVMAVEDAAAEYAKLDKPEPGQYDMKVEILSFNMPGAPENMLDMIKTNMEGSFADGYCLTPEEADKGFEEQLGQIGNDGQCDFNNLSVDGGNVTGKATCEMQGGTMQMGMNGTVTSTSSDLTIDTVVDAGGKAMEMTMQVTQKRTGDCA